MITSTIAAVVGVLGLLGGGLVMYTKIVQHLSRIESKVDQTAKLAAHVPGVYARVSHLENYLGVHPPELPVFFNGHAEK